MDNSFHGERLICTSSRVWLNLSSTPPRFGGSEKRKKSPDRLAAEYFRVRLCVRDSESELSAQEGTKRARLAGLSR